jgi:hypothetical protein
MANYLARLAAAGSRVGFDARSSFLPPATMPAVGRAKPENEAPFDLVEEHPGVVVEPDSPAIGVVIEPPTSQRTAPRSPRERSPQADDRDPQPHSPASVRPGSTRERPLQADDRNPNLLASAQPIGSTSAPIGPMPKLPLDKKPGEARTPPPQIRTPFIGAPSAWRASQQSSETDKPADTLQKTNDRRVLPVHHHSARRLETALPTIPRTPEIIATAAPTLRTRASDLPKASEVANRHLRDESAAAESHTTATAQPAMAVELPIVRPSMPLPPPHVPRNTEPETRITIGRVDVQVNNQPLVSPHLRPAPKPGSNQQDILRTRFLDRFTLRP